MKGRFRAPNEASTMLMYHKPRANDNAAFHNYHRYRFGRRA